MTEAAFETFSLAKKVPAAVSHKISEVKNSNSLVSWATLYFEFHVFGSPQKTVEAKTKEMITIIPPIKVNITRSNAIAFW